MSFQDLLGNDRVKDQLTRMVEKGVIGNSLLFAGPEGVGKSLFAAELAKILISSVQEVHPDIHVYRPTGKLGLHTIESMRQLSQDVYLAPFEAKWKVFIIHDAERMLPYSANALLKTFEEPSLDTLIILLSSSPESLLPTVLSRCRTVYFQPIADELITTYLTTHAGKDNQKAKSLAKRAQGSIGRALTLAEKGGDDEIRIFLFKVLAAGKIDTYKELQAFAAKLGDAVDQSKKQIEESTREELLASFTDTLSAVQKQALEKEIEGAVSKHYSEEVDAILGIIFGWYRDMHLLHVDGNPDYLLNPAHKDQLHSALQNDGLFSLEEIQTHIRQAKLAIERSTSLNICLESLFLKLNFL